MSDTLEINKREYPSSFSKTAIVICLDGSQKEYLDEASKSNLTPNLDKLIASGETYLFTALFQVLQILIIFPL